MMTANSKVIEDVLDREVTSFRQRALVISLLLFVAVDYIDAPQVFLVMFIAPPSNAFEHNSFAKNAKTIATEWGLKGSDLDWVTSFLQSIFFVGFMIGTTLFGQLSDKFGRKSISFKVYIAIMCSSFMAAFTQTWQQLAVCRFVSGLCVGGLSVINFVLIQEASSARSWVTNGVFTTSVFGLLMVITEIIAYLFPDWRTFCVVSTLPGLFGFLFYAYQPESPRWLLSKGRAYLAVKSLEVLSRRNGREGLLAERESLIEEERLCSLGNESTGKHKTGSVRDLFTHRVLRRRTIILGFIWFCTSFVFYCITLGAGAFSPNFYVAFAGSAISQLPSAPLCYYFMRRKWWGRRRTLTAFMCITSISMLLTFLIFDKEEYFQYRLLLSMAAKVGVQGAFSLIYVYTPELYPTVVRNVGLGYMSTMARVGSAVAPFLANYTLRSGMRTPYLVYSILCALSGYVALRLPETIGNNIINTLEDASSQEEENFSRK